MQLVLVLGDMHIPQRKAKLPDQFKALLGVFLSGVSSCPHSLWLAVPGKIQHVLCTGNVVSKTMVRACSGTCAQCFD